MKIIFTYAISSLFVGSAWALGSAERCYTGVAYYPDKNNPDACTGKRDQTPSSVYCTATYTNFQGICGYYVAEDVYNPKCYAVVGYCSNMYNSESGCESYAHDQARIDSIQFNIHNNAGNQKFNVLRSKCCSTNNCNHAATQKPLEASSSSSNSRNCDTVCYIGVGVFVFVLVTIIGTCVLVSYLKRLAKMKKKMAKKIFKDQQRQLAMQQHHQQQQHQRQQVHMNQFPTQPQPVHAPASAVTVVNSQPMVQPVVQPVVQPMVQPMVQPVVQPAAAHVVTAQAVPMAQPVQAVSTGAPMYQATAVVVN